jgi:tetratricopeptide (TPR) repeat protein
MAQHPQFEPFKSAWRAKQYDDALAHIDAVIAAHPRVASLHWYRANCLEKLERYAEAVQAVDAVLAIDPGHAPALVKQVALDWAREQDDVDDDEAELTPAQEAAQERRHAEQRQRHIAQIRRALAIDPNLADASFALSQLLRNVDPSESPAQSAQADTLLERAIALAPERIGFRAARGELRQMRALQVPDDAPDDACVQNFAGLKYLRAELEGALQDFLHCAQADGTHRYPVRAARVLHDLGRFDEALAQYDLALERLPAGAPQRDFLLQARARSENNGAGERDQMAAMLEGLIEPGDRNLADDNAATLLLGAARAVRKGKRMDEALAARLSESPDDLLAANFAEQILNVAYENPPDLVAVDRATFPTYQRHYAARQAKALAAAGLRHVADAEATGMTPTLGQRALLAFHVDDSGAIGVDTFALKPKWPGLVGFLLMFFTGKWKTHTMTECITHFDDDGFLITQYESISSFDHAKVVDIERLPPSTSVAALVARHRQRVADYRQTHPRARALPATNLVEIESNIRRGQALKRDYRRSIGFITDGELRKMLGGHYDRFAQKIRTKLDELAEDREESFSGA